MKTLLTGRKTGSGRQPGVWLSYEDAKRVVHALGFSSRTSWEQYLRGNIINGVPRGPQGYYKDNGWCGWGDFLGTGRIQDQKVHEGFLPYAEARQYLSKFKFTGESDFYPWSKTDARPIFIPASPRKTYLKSGWISMGDFLGNGNIAPTDYQFLPFEDAMTFAHTQGFLDGREWHEWAKTKKRPANLPFNPDQVYPNEWRGWAYFLGYKRRTSYGEKLVMHFLETNSVEYRWQQSFPGCRHKNKLPFDFAVYDSGRLVGIIEYHGKQHYEHSEFLNSARIRITDPIKAAYCADNKIPLLVIPYLKEKNVEHLVLEFLTRHLPGRTLVIHPRQVIERGTGWLPFSELRDYVRTLGLKTQLEWMAWAKENRPPQCPYNPINAYADSGWTSWGDFLGTGWVHSLKARDHMVDYESCRQWMLANGIRSCEQWKARNSKPSNIPSHPEVIYKGLGWRGWRAFLTPEA